jgi:hypothetical protein
MHARAAPPPAPAPSRQATRDRLVPPPKMRLQLVGAGAPLGDTAGSAAPLPRARTPTTARSDSDDDDAPRGAARTRAPRAVAPPSRAATNGGRGGGGGGAVVSWADSAPPGVRASDPAPMQWTSVLRSPSGTTAGAYSPTGGEGGEARRFACRCQGLPHHRLTLPRLPPPLLPQIATLHLLVAHTARAPAPLPNPRPRCCFGTTPPSPNVAGVASATAPTLACRRLPAWVGQPSRPLPPHPTARPSNWCWPTRYAAATAARPMAPPGTCGRWHDTRTPAPAPAPAKRPPRCCPAAPAPAAQPVSRRRPASTATTGRWASSRAGAVVTAQATEAVAAGLAEPGVAAWELLQSPLSDPAPPSWMRRCCCSATGR